MRSILMTLLEINIFAAVMIGVVLLIRKLFSRRMNSALMLVLWAMVLVRLCLPYTFESPVHINSLWPRETILTRQPETVDNRGILQGASAAVMQPQGEDTPLISKDSAGAQPTKAAPSFFESISVYDLIAFIWLAGAASVLLIFLARGIIFSRNVRRCPQLDESLIAQSKARIGINRRVCIRGCDFVAAPAVFGYLRPTILLPFCVVENTKSDSLNAMLLHELYHIKNHDILMGYLWLLAKAAHWFNPLVWLAYRKYGDDVEICRDNSAALLKGVAIYGKSLIDAARLSAGMRANGYLTASLMEHKSALKDRVTRLVRPARRSKGCAAAAMLMAALMIVCCFTTACQPTPSQTVVIGKNDGKLEEKINATPFPQASESSPENSGELRKTLGAPES